MPRPHLPSDTCSEEGGYKEPPLTVYPFRFNLPVRLA